MYVPKSFASSFEFVICSDNSDISIVYSDPEQLIFVISCHSVVNEGACDDPGQDLVAGGEDQQVKRLKVNINYNNLAKLLSDQDNKILREAIF